MNSFRDALNTVIGNEHRQDEEITQIYEHLATMAELSERTAKQVTETKEYVKGKMESLSLWKQAMALKAESMSDLSRGVLQLHETTSEMLERLDAMSKRHDHEREGLWNRCRFLEDQLVELKSMVTHIAEQTDARLQALTERCDGTDNRIDRDGGSLLLVKGRQADTDATVAQLVQRLNAVETKLHNIEQTGRVEGE
jgi:chromosome segregation ATPase